MTRPTGHQCRLCGKGHARVNDAARHERQTCLFGIIGSTLTVSSRAVIRPDAPQAIRDRLVTNGFHPTANPDVFVRD